MTLRLTAALAAVLFLGACAETTTRTIRIEGPTRPLPPEFMADVQAAGFAEALVEECRTLRFNDRYERAVVNGHVARLTREGYTEIDLIASLQGINEAELQSDIFRYIEKRRILVAQPQTWCAAGDAEIAEGTRIGRYLIKR